MLRSLHFRMFAATALAIVVALGVVALLSRQAAITEYRRVEVTRRDVGPRDVAAELERALAGAEPPVALGPFLARLAQSHGRDLVLVGDDGRVIASSSPELAQARATRRPDGMIVVERDVTRGDGPRRMRATLRAAAMGAPVRGATGTLGTLAMLPRMGGELPGLEEPFGRAFDLRILLGVAAALGVALAFTWWLSRRIVGPIEALTAAARRLEAGDRDSRVTVASRDEIGELAHAFNAMAESLARQETLRRTLVSDVAHELRTPLTNLRCQIEAVEDGLLEASPDTVRSLREEVLLLSRLVDDLQTVAVAEAGRLALDRAPVALRDLVDGALEAFRAMATERGLTLRQDVPELPPALADPTRIAQVLRNLLTNAATHTPAGGSIDVAARTVGTQIEVSVTDTGDGIAPDDLSRVFERFYRADRSRARATGGAGLGLAIVKGIVEAHGGVVGVTSTPGRGARFTFTVPLA